MSCQPGVHYILSFINTCTKYCGWLPTACLVGKHSLAGIMHVAEGIADWKQIGCTDGTAIHNKDLAVCCLMQHYSSALTILTDESDDSSEPQILLQSAQVRKTFGNTGPSV